MDMIRYDMIHPAHTTYVLEGSPSCNRLTSICLSWAAHRFVALTEYTFRSCTMNVGATEYLFILHSSLNWIASLLPRRSLLVLPSGRWFFRLSLQLSPSTVWVLSLPHARNFSIQESSFRTRSTKTRQLSLLKTLSKAYSSINPIETVSVMQRIANWVKLSGESSEGDRNILLPFHSIAPLGTTDNLLDIVMIVC